MLRSHSLIAILSLVGGSVIVSEVVSSAPRGPEYFCYQQTNTGQVQNLTQMCQKAQLQSSASNSTAATKNNASTSSPNKQSTDKSKASADRVRIADQARRRKIEFSDYSYDGSMLVGTVRNRTGAEIGSISIVYQVEVREGEGKWRTVDNGSVLTNNRQLNKNGKSNFSTSRMRSGDRITITDVEFD